jgi:hypothetical protein
MNDGQHSQMAYQSSETLKQEYESQGQAQGQADKTEVSEATVLFNLAVLVHASVDAHPLPVGRVKSPCRTDIL